MSVGVCGYSRAAGPSAGRASASRSVPGLCSVALTYLLTLKAVPLALDYCPLRVTPGSSFLKVLLVLWGSLPSHVNSRTRVCMHRGFWHLTGVPSSRRSTPGLWRLSSIQSSRRWSLAVDTTLAAPFPLPAAAPGLPTFCLSSARPHQTGPLDLPLILLLWLVRTVASQGPLRPRPRCPHSCAAPVPTAPALPAHRLGHQQTFWLCLQNVSRVSLSLLFWNLPNAHLPCPHFHESASGLLEAVGPRDQRAEDPASCSVT